MERKISSGLILVADDSAEANKVPTQGEDYTLELDKEVYRVGEEIKFKATAPSEHTWVGLYHKNDVIPDDMSYFWFDLLPADQEPSVPQPLVLLYLPEQVRYRH